MSMNISDTVDLRDQPTTRLDSGGSDLSTCLWDEIKSASQSGNNQERVNHGTNIGFLDFSNDIYKSVQDDVGSLGPVEKRAGDPFERPFEPIKMPGGDPIEHRFEPIGSQAKFDSYTVERVMNSDGSTTDVRNDRSKVTYNRPDGTVVIEPPPGSAERRVTITPGKFVDIEMNNGDQVRVFPNGERVTTKPDNTIIRDFPPETCGPSDPVRITRTPDGKVMWQLKDGERFYVESGPDGKLIKHPIKPLTPDPAKPPMVPDPA